MSPAASATLTVPQVARLLAVPQWAVRRAVDALTPPVGRLALWRVIPPERLDEVRAVLEARGFLKGAADT
jgi:hypothetical protein